MDNVTLPLLSVSYFDLNFAKNLIQEVHSSILGIPTISATLWIPNNALFIKNWYSASIPVLLFCFFAFYNAPKLDKYLAEKYGKGFEEYARKTKMLVPFLY
ncbi:MAG: hypothetical protein ABI378_10855 [Chitinophagaceae bacterium]